MTTTPKSQGAAIDQAGAPADLVRQALQCIHDTFKRDMEQGYQTRDKAFAVSLAASALAAPAGDTQQASGDEALLAARAEGRAEAVEILTGLCAESGIDEYTGWGRSGAPEDEGAAYWKVEKLRELFKCDDKLFNLFDRAESVYWQAKGEKDEAEREMRLVEQAPFYKPLHDFLSKHQAWDLMGDLKRAAAPAQAADARVAQQANEDARDARIAMLKKALNYYADGHHLMLADPDAWDTVSGEPMNFLCDEAGTATVEDGTVAKCALAGDPLADDEERRVSASQANKAGLGGAK